MISQNANFILETKKKQEKSKFTFFMVILFRFLGFQTLNKNQATVNLGFSEARKVDKSKRELEQHLT